MNKESLVDYACISGNWEHIASEGQSSAHTKVPRNNHSKSLLSVETAQMPDRSCASKFQAAARTQNKFNRGLALFRSCVVVGDVLEKGRTDRRAVWIVENLIVRVFSETE